MSILTHLLAEVFSDDLLDLLHAALRSSAVEHLQCGRVLLRQQVVQGTEVLTHLDESTPVGTAQVSKTLRWPPMHLQVMEQRKETRIEKVRNRKQSVKNCWERLRARSTWIIIFNAWYDDMWQWWFFKPRFTFSLAMSLVVSEVKGMSESSALEVSVHWDNNTDHFTHCGNPLWDPGLEWLYYFMSSAFQLNQKYGHLINSMWSSRAHGQLTHNFKKGTLSSKMCFSSGAFCEEPVRKVPSY